MSFWTDFEGNSIDGSKANDNAGGGFSLVPGGTKALAVIEGAEDRNSEKWGRSYSIKWRLIGGEYKNRVQFQRIDAFNPDPKKSGIAKHKLAKMFVLAGKPLPTHEPTNSDLGGLVGAQAGLTIEIFEPKDGGEAKNFVSVIDIPTGFQCVTGTRMPKQSAAQAPAAAAGSDNFDDAPF